MINKISRSPAWGFAAVAMVVILNSHIAIVFAQSAAFTYQGRLNAGANAANGSYDLRFSIYDSVANGIVVGNSLTNSATTLSNGLFTVTLDFGPGIFDGNARWLDIAVRTNGAGAFTTLVPRQTLAPTPYAMMANSASNLLGTLSAAQVSGTLASGNLPISPVLSGTVTAAGFNGNGANITNVNAATLNGLTSAGFWKTNGNTGTNPTNGAFLGTADNLPLELKVNGSRALRLEPNATSPNVVGGYSGNIVSNGVYGAFIGGGGHAGSPNRAGGIYASVLGGYGNTASGTGSTALGSFATASGDYSVAMGNGATASDDYSTAIGAGTTASGLGSTAIGINTIASGVYCTALGFNTTSGEYSTAMGAGTTASGWTSTAMGCYTTASGYRSTAMGGYTTASGLNSMAMGFNAQATNTGAFVWADSSSYSTPFTSTATNQFLVRATGGVGINKNNPATALDVDGTVTSTGLSLSGPAQLNDQDIFLRADGLHGLGWYGAGKEFAAVNMDGPVLYGFDGGGLGAMNGGEHLALHWNYAGNVAIDPNGLNNGWLLPGLTFGNNSGEGISSKRTSGTGQYGLDFYANYALRMTIGNGGNVGIGIVDPIAETEIYGSGQTTAALADSGSRGGMLMLNTDNGSAGNGGAVLFGNQQSHTANSLGFAAIKGLLSNGSENTSGDLAFSTRNAITDTALAERMRITSAGSVGIGKTNPATALDVNGTVTATRFSGTASNTRFTAANDMNLSAENTLTLSAASDLILRGSAISLVGTVQVGTIEVSDTLYMNDHDLQMRNDQYHGLGFYGSPKTFAGIDVNGPVLYGNNGGALGSKGGAFTNAALLWNSSGAVIIDPNNANAGSLSPGLAFGLGSGEGISSRRTSGTGQYGLDFYANSALRMRISNSGNVGIGNTTPGYLLVVGGSGSPAYCNGTTWVNGSDRNSKEAFTTINPRDVLEKVSALPITQWKYKVEADGTEHIGPMAQDFHAAFGLNGSDDKHIATVDESGVALAAIQGLNEKVEEQKAENAALKARLEKLEQLLEGQSK